MKIALINPPMQVQNEIDYICGHLGVGYIASYLVNSGYSVDIIDCPSDRIHMKELLIMLEKETYDVIGFSTYFYNWINVLKIVKWLRKKYNDNLFIFLGGYLPTLSFQKIPHNLDVNCFVLGEGEETCLNLISNLSNGNWKNVKGIVYLDKDKDEYIFTGKRELIHDLDMIPFPMRPKSNCYELDLITSRGCYNRCTFCAIGSYYKMCSGNIVRRRSPENVVKEIEELIDCRQLAELNFADDCLSIIPDKNNYCWIEHFITLIKSKGISIRYSCFMRADEIVANPQQVKNFMQIGLSYVFVGIESFLPKHLKFYNKHVTREENYKALQILESLGCRFNIGYILFNPITTIEDVEETIEIFEKLKFNSISKHVIMPVGASYAIATEGSPLYHFVKENNCDAKNERGYKIIDEKAELCFQVMKIWADGYQDLIAKYYLKKILPDYYSAINLAIRNCLYELFNLDLKVLKEVTQLISIEHWLNKEQFKEKLEKWAYQLQCIREQFNSIDKAESGI